MSESLVIEIPGYRILRQLGRGGMATVYLAIQESVDREVALKVMNAALNSDPRFGERFLREARIAAKLHHRHVVGVHDVARVGDTHYIAMEYLSKGSVLEKRAEGIDSSFSLRVVREIALALGYAHSKGFIHRDVKPDNIFLRDDGTAALGDFGIARATDSDTQMTRAGSVVGTPHYMSPEQARGRQIDGRADLYSLGVVLYEMLVGKVPFHAEESLAVGIMHITEPVPRVPERLIWFQPLLDGMLAKKPEDRFQSGEAVAEAIKEYEKALAQNENSAQTGIMDASALSERLEKMRTAPAPKAASSLMRDGRSEPSIGSMDSNWSQMISQDSLRPQRVETSKKSRGLWLGLLAAIALVGAAGWKYQNELRALIPETELVTTLDRADQALAEEFLTGTRGLSAQELYLSALAEDPDNARAVNGLRQVGERLIGKSHERLQEGDLLGAKMLAVSAREVLQGGVQLERLEASIAAQDRKQTDTSDQFVRADSAREQGNLIGNENSAVALYLGMLALDAENGLVKHGLDQVIEQLGTQVQALIGEQQFDDAEVLLGRMNNAVPTHQSLPPLHAAIADARNVRSKAIEAKVVDLEKRISDGKINAKTAQAALNLAAEIQELDAANVRVRVARKTIAQSMLSQAAAVIDDRGVDQADALIALARKAGASGGELAALVSRSREMREKVDIAAKMVQLSPAQQQQIASYLQEAKNALEVGALIIPPVDCAYDKYRAVLSIDHSNADAKKGMAELPAAAKAWFEKSIGNDVRLAHGYVDALRELSSKDPAYADLEKRLLDRYVQEIERNIAEKKLNSAERLLIRARGLNASDVRLDRLGTQLQIARGE